MSDGRRKSYGPGEAGEARIRSTIDALLDERGEGRTICPSEAARELGDDDGFRPLMDEVREVAYAMADDGRIEVTQSGEVVDGRQVRGPIRLRRPSD